MTLRTTLTRKIDGGPDVPLLPWLQKLLDQYAPNGVEWKSIKDVALVDIGSFVRSDKQWNDKPYPVYNGGRSNTGYYDEYNHDGDYILISARGANAGFVNQISGKYWAGNSCYSVYFGTNVLFRYAYHVMKMSEAKLLGQQQTGSIPAVSKEQVMNFRIPIPPLEVQEAIVAALDKFSELCADISLGLPAEIAARQKQYEYYRDKLLALEVGDISRAGVNGMVSRM